jgi:hypothetical protein
LGIKFFCTEGVDIPLVRFIPVLHRWIQNGETDTVLIDVADYSHVVQGPGILLAAHEGNYSIDETHGRRGLVYYQKTEEAGDLAARLTRVARRALAACAKLESEPEFAGELRFSATEFEIFANDRLLAPNVPEVYDALAPHIDALSAKLFGDVACEVDRATDPRDRTSLHVRASSSGDVTALLARVGD